MCVFIDDVLSIRDDDYGCILMMELFMKIANNAIQYNTKRKPNKKFLS
jgi:hypothetical protein